MSMQAMAALRILAMQRGEAVVVPTMSGARGWATVSTRPERLACIWRDGQGVLGGAWPGPGAAKPPDHYRGRRWQPADELGIGGHDRRYAAQESVFTPSARTRCTRSPSAHTKCRASRLCRDRPGCCFARAAQVFDDAAALERDLPALLAADGPSFLTLSFPFEKNR